MVWAAGGSGASPSRGAIAWDAPTILAQVTPPGGTDEGGEDEEEQEFQPSDTLGVEEGEPLNPDTTQAPPSVPPPLQQATPAETLRSAAPDPSTAPLDTLQGTPGYVPLPPDSAAAAATDSAAKETLFVAQPKPQPQTPKPSPSPTPAKEPKVRKGILGVHPIAILLGLAALHYFVTKSAGD